MDEAEQLIGISCVCTCTLRVYVYVPLARWQRHRMMLNRHATHALRNSYCTCKCCGTAASPC